MVVVSDGKPLMEHTPQNTSAEREKLQAKIDRLEEEIKQFKADHLNWADDETHEQHLTSLRTELAAFVNQLTALMGKQERGGNGFHSLPLCFSHRLL